MNPDGPILITGAGGFLGRNLALQLSELRRPLLLLPRRPEPFLSALPGARVLAGDLHRRLPELDARDCRALVHLASSTNPRLGTIHDELAQLERLAALLEWARGAPGLPVVFLSSGGTVYADRPGPHVEEETLQPASSYAWGKAAAEDLLGYYARAFDLRVQIVRCANPYGPEQPINKRQGLVMKLLSDVRDGRATEIWGDGSEVRDYFFAGDLCELLARMLEVPEQTGVFNAGSGRGASVNEVIQAVEQAVGRLPKIEYAPRPPRMVLHNVLDTRRAWEAFAWRATTSLTDGIRATWLWLEGQARLAGGRGPASPLAAGPSLELDGRG